tara:strand:- start:232 stop:402 length:171 start_codon:yes stop_codon:yes gene_type:complete
MRDFNIRRNLMVVIAGSIFATIRGRLHAKASLATLLRAALDAIKTTQVNGDKNEIT